MSEQPQDQCLSVVLIGRNEGERLRRCLRSVFAMELPGWELEVIYVDSHSTDGSVALAEDEGAKAIELPPGPTTAAKGRNAGLEVATGEYVLFLDGDTILDSTFVRTALSHFDENVVGVFGHRRELEPERNFYQSVLDLDWVWPLGEADYCGGDVLFRRRPLEEVGGYDETLIAGEEPELCNRLRTRGWKLLHIDAPMTLHDFAIHRFDQYWRRARRTGYAYAEVSERFKETDFPLWRDVAEHNRRYVATMGVLTAGLLFLAVLRMSLLPVAAWVVVVAGLMLRSAWRTRWKTSDWRRLLQYGVHSHGQHLPIFLGQLQYQRERRQQRRSGIIEYR